MDSERCFPDVSALSLRARLAVALHLFRGYCDRRGVDHPEIRRYLDHLWDFIELYGDAEAFGRWVEQEPPLTHTGLGDPFPPGFAGALAAAGVPEGEFRRALGSCTEVLYTSLYAAAGEGWSRRYLYELARAVVPLGAAWPDLGRFAGSRWADDQGWGNRPSPQEVARWRAGGA